MDMVKPEPERPLVKRARFATLMVAGAVVMIVIAAMMTWSAMT